MKNTNNNLVTEIVQAITPIFQKYLEANVSEADRQTPKVKKLTTSSQHELTYLSIASNTSLDVGTMRQMVNLKIRGSKQEEIAKELNTSQSRVSIYLKAFKTHYKLTTKQQRLEVA